jgi:hypothetical protein
MYPPSTIRRIQELLAAGVTHRAIARELKVSKGLVGQVNRGDKVQRERPTGNSSFERLEEPVRCGRCGSLVTESPCRRCYLLAVTSQAEAKPASVFPMPAFNVPAPAVSPDELPEAEGDAASYLAAPAFLEPNAGPAVPDGRGERDPSAEQIRRRCAAIRASDGLTERA